MELSFVVYCRMIVAIRIIYTNQTHTVLHLLRHETGDQGAFK